MIYGSWDMVYRNYIIRRVNPIMGKATYEGNPVKESQHFIVGSAIIGTRNNDAFIMVWATQW